MYYGTFKRSLSHFISFFIILLILNFGFARLWYEIQYSYYLWWSITELKKLLISSVVKFGELFRNSNITNYFKNWKSIFCDLNHTMYFIEWKNNYLNFLVKIRGLCINNLSDFEIQRFIYKNLYTYYYIINVCIVIFLHINIIPVILSYA